MVNSHNDISSRTIQLKSTHESSKALKCDEPKRNVSKSRSLLLKLKPKRANDYNLVDEIVDLYGSPETPDTSILPTSLRISNKNNEKNNNDNDNDNKDTFTEIFNENKPREEQKSPLSFSFRFWKSEYWSSSFSPTSSTYGLPLRDRDQLFSRKEVLDRIDYNILDNLPFEQRYQDGIIKTRNYYEPNDTSIYHTDLAVALKTDRALKRKLMFFKKSKNTHSG